jgi:hypothetical protein
MRMNNSVRKINMLVYPANPSVSKPEIRQMRAEDVSPGLMNSRIRIKDHLATPAIPDKNGDYLFEPGSPQFDQVNTFYYVAYTLRMYENYAGRTLPWSFKDQQISIDPHAGVGGNVFYSELDHLIGFSAASSGDHNLNMAKIPSLVCHVAGHAILDGMRTLYNESFGLGSNAFHESFSDISSMLVALHDDVLIRRLLSSTKGDLMIDNFIASLDENMTSDMSKINHTGNQRVVSFRNALNNLTELPFDELVITDNKARNDLSRDKRNYSRLFTGAFYNILVSIFVELRRVIPPANAIRHARDIMGYLITYAVEMGPVAELNFADLAKSLLTADTILYSGQNIEIMKEEFDQRKILSSEIAENHLGSLTRLPEIYLSKPVLSTEESLRFLESVVRPALGLSEQVVFTPLSVFQNERGFSYLTYRQVRRLTLIGQNSLIIMGLM